MYACALFSHFCTIIGSIDSLNLHIQVYGCYILLIRYMRRPCYLKSVASLLLDHPDSLVQVISSFSSSWFLLILHILDSVVILLVIHRITLSCVEFICNIVVTLLSLLLIYITFLGHFRLSMYTQGIFLAYIRCGLSSRLHSSEFLKSGAWQT